MQMDNQSRTDCVLVVYRLVLNSTTMATYSLTHEIHFNMMNVPKKQVEI